MPTPVSTAPGKGQRFLTRVAQLERLTPRERRELERVTERYAFRALRSYLDLIDWRDANDPIRRIIVPHPNELADWGHLDASDEASITVAAGTQHKYPDTALLLCNETCAGFCRYCFRKRLFMRGNQEARLDVSAGIAYIAQHPEISDVLLTGGDPLLLSSERLLDIISAVAGIAHVRVIRIGSKLPAFDPMSLLSRPELIAGLARAVEAGTAVYLMTHFDHPRELTEVACEALALLQRAGVVCANQCPIVRGVNDDPDTLSELFARLSAAGVAPYYLFQGRPTSGNAPFEVPISTGFLAFDTARGRVSGLAGRARMVMSHALGKIEVLALDSAHLYLRFHRAKHVADRGRFMTFARDDEAYWLDALEPLSDVGPNVRDHLQRSRNDAARATTSGGPC